MSSSEVLAPSRRQTNDTTTGGTIIFTGRRIGIARNLEVFPITLAVTCGVDIPANESSNDDRLPKRLLCSITTFLAHFVALCTHNEALRAATSDSDVDQVTENLKSEWTKVGRWLLALATLNVSLLTMDSQPMFKVDEFAQNLIALSAVTTGLGVFYRAPSTLLFHLSCLSHRGTWFDGEIANCARDSKTRSEDAVFDHDRARDTCGSYTYFALSSELPFVAVLVSMMSLMAFGGRIVYNTLPTFILLMGSSCFGIIMVLRFIVRGGRVLYSFIFTTHSAVSGWFLNRSGIMQARRDAGVGNGSGLQLKLLEANVKIVIRNSMESINKQDFGDFTNFVSSAETLANTVTVHRQLERFDLRLFDRLVYFTAWRHTASGNLKAIECRHSTSQLQH
ncbi:hypothetical protein GGX14DRAFT_604637 [Mycena pura]|uniref:Uncharacterized protein n=1 Tax=Mycena pura TaxID=153505 RepID=A0AAD6VPL6_9AGAR|nr:hypothetical protein GGX14DRAFT_604637 [Mycena pura]